MAVTVVPNLTDITLAESVTNYYYNTAWGGTTAGGTIDSEVFVQGANSVGFAVVRSNTKWIEYHPSSPLNMSASDTHLYIWLRCNVAAFLNTKSVGGVNVRIGSGASSANYKSWYVAGSDTWDGRWKCFVININATADQSSGTLDYTLINSIGVQFQTGGTTIRNVTNTWVDAWRFGTGLTAYGSTSFNFNDIATQDMTTANKYGVIENIDGVIYCQGRLTIGDSGGSNTNFDSSDEVLVFPERLVSNTLYQINFVKGSGTTDVDIGFIVGSGATAKGRNGTLIMGANSNVKVSITINNNLTSCNVYGSIFRRISNGITINSNSSYDFIGNTIDQSGQFVPNTCEMTNIVISNTSSTSGGMLWNQNINIQNSTFIFNTAGAAIEHNSSTGSPFTYTNLQFSGCTYDVNNSSGTSISVNKASGSNPSTYTGSSVTFLGSILLKMTVKDESGTKINSAYAYIDDNNQTPFIMNTTTDVNGEASISYTGSPVTGSYWRVRKYGYKAYNQLVDIGGIDITLPITLIVDPQQN